MNTWELYQKIVEYNIPKKSLKQAIFDAMSEKGPKIPVDYIISQADPHELVELLGIIHQYQKEGEVIEKTNARKHLGIYYTSYELARFITRETLNLKSIDPEKVTFLEPCAGTGNFVIAYLDEVLINVKNPPKPLIQTIVNNIYCSDIDHEAITLLQNILPLYIKRKYGVLVNIPTKNYFAGNILFKKEGDKINRNDPRIIFNIKNGFDVIITNPPYKLLKANSNKYEDSNNKQSVNEIVDYIRKNTIYPLNEGTLNYYKIFTEEIALNYSHEKSLIGLLIPRTLLNDKQSQKLRGYLFNNFKISAIHTIPEKNKFFPDVSQEFCFFSIDKSHKGGSISIVDNIISTDDFGRNGSAFDIKDLNRISSSLITLPEIGMQILQKIHQHPKISEVTSLINLRGELDLTLHKKYITTSKTELKLIKGKDIGEFKIHPSSEYVSPDFLQSINGKNAHPLMARLVCQQISNVNSRKRVKFARIEPNHVLGNSCNYLAIQTKKELFEAPKFSLWYLLGILNSLLIDWRFRISNSNNHIANYELDDLPIPINGNADIIKEIERIAKSLATQYSKTLFDELNDLTFKLYGLNTDEAAFILSQYTESPTEPVLTTLF